MADIISKIESTIKRHGLIETGDQVLIALSGGPDSVALFHLLMLIAGKYNLEITAAHVDHKLRADSAIDRKFCRELCKAYNCRFHSISVNINKKAEKLKTGIEAAGRAARYDYFQNLCIKYGYTKIATGHNANDSAETFLLNLARGADISGLTGIPIRRANIIRPLLDIPKVEILNFLKDNGLSYRIDKSNVSLKYNRNVVRNQILPSLEKINSQAMKHINSSAQSFQYSFELIQTLVDEHYPKCLVRQSKSQIVLDLGKLPVYYKSLRSWILLKAFQALAGDFSKPDSLKIELAVNLSRRGAVTFLGNGIYAANHDDNLILSRPPQRFRRINLVKGGMNNLPGSGLSIKATVLEKFDKQEIFANDDETTCYLDDSKVGELAARSFKDGDSFRPLGMSGTKKVADYLNDKGVSRLAKPTIPIITSGKEIAWIAGFGIADKFKVTVKTERVLNLQMIGETY